MRRVNFDSNDRDEDGRFILTLPGSIASLERLESPLTIGERVVIFMDDLEGEAVIEWNATERFRGWVARADETAWRDV